MIKPNELIERRDEIRAKKEEALKPVRKNGR